MKTATIPDGRTVSGSQPDPTGNWTIHLEGTTREASNRWLLDALSDLLDLPRYDKPDWVFELVRELAGEDTPLGRRFACPCCDYLTLTEPPAGSHAICPVCRWEDDLVQYCDLHYTGGANRMSLSQARNNYRLHGTSKPNGRGTIRPPLPEEKPKADSR